MFFRTFKDTKNSSKSQIINTILTMKYVGV